LHLSLVSSLALAHQRSKARQQLNATFGGHASQVFSAVPPRPQLGGGGLSLSFCAPTQESLGERDLL